MASGYTTLSSEKVITGNDVFEAMKKNGYRHYQNGWFQYDPSDSSFEKVVGACIMGQAALNLEVHREGISLILNGIRMSYQDLENLDKVLEDLGTNFVTRLSAVPGVNLTDVIIMMNDTFRIPYERMLGIIETFLPRFKDSHIMAVMVAYKIGKIEE